MNATRRPSAESEGSDAEAEAAGGATTRDPPVAMSFTTTRLPRVNATLRPPALTTGSQASPSDTGTVWPVRRSRR